jgi:hypothetical protein
LDGSMWRSSGQQRRVDSSSGSCTKTVARETRTGIKHPSPISLSHFHAGIWCLCNQPDRYSRPPADSNFNNGLDTGLKMSGKIEDAIASPNRGRRLGVGPRETSCFPTHRGNAGRGRPSRECRRRCPLRRTPTGAPPPRLLRLPPRARASASAVGSQQRKPAQYS